MEVSELFLSLILCDSALPSGSLAHSNGLESAFQSGFVTRDDESLQTYVVIALEQVIHQLMPVLDVAWTLGEELKIDIKQDEVIQKLVDLERQCAATLASNAVACRASINQGNQ